MRYAAWRIMPDGKRRRINPSGRSTTFNRATMLRVKLRARRLGHRIIVKRIVTKRDRMRNAIRWASEHEPRLHYRQSRPIPVRALLRRKLPIYTDCSGYVTMICRAAGLPDPNGNRYNGAGYTGTLRAHMRHVAFDKLKFGDIIVYGGGSSGAHTVMVVRGGSDPVVTSFGQESGPRYYRHSQQRAVHPGAFTCHRPDGLQ